MNKFLKMYKKSLLRPELAKRIFGKMILLIFNIKHTANVFVHKLKKTNEQILHKGSKNPIFRHFWA